MRQVSAIAVGCSLALTAACGHAASHPAVHAPSSGPASAGPTSGPHAPRWPRLRDSVVRWRLPYAVSRAALVADGPAAAVLAGGMLPDDTSTDHAVRVDLATGGSRSLPHLAVPIHDAAGGTVRGRPTVFGGGNATEQSAIQVLGLRGWRVVGHLPTTRSDLSVVTVSGAGFVLGGYDGTGTPRGVLRAAAGAGVRRMGALRRGVRYAASAVIGHSAYLFGGEVSGAELTAVQRVDLTTGRTRVVARLPRPLGHAMAVPLGRRVLLVGGCVAPDRRTRATWWFDPATSRFHGAGELPVATSDGTLVRGPGGAWLLGGETGGAPGIVTDRVVHLRVPAAGARIMAP